MFFSQENSEKTVKNFIFRVSPIPLTSTTGFAVGSLIAQKLTCGPNREYITPIPQAKNTYLIVSSIS